ncbi:WW domain-containing oxidoreductase [Cladorrhinum sp. PSN332]|nr:WW domain-containing oxidoreductase [Cladorrhinum sp. PSN332]
MTSLAKTIVATGASSGLGFELVKQLLTQQSQAYKFILGARDVSRTEAAYSSLKFDSGTHSLTILPLELADIKTAKSFAQQTLQNLGDDKLDYLLLNAGISDGADKPGRNGTKWCESYIVNHLSQHYLIHLLREKLVASSSRIVVVSSGAVQRVQDPGTLGQDLLHGSGVAGHDTYSQTKFVQLLGAHWWRRQLSNTGCKVVAVSPGLVPNTGIGKGSGMNLTMDMPDAKTVSQGAQSILAAFTRDDLPEDPEQIFLTSWGEWWSKDVYGKTLDQGLQDKWCPSKEEIEREEGL